MDDESKKNNVTRNKTKEVEMDEVVVLAQGQSASVRRSAGEGERCVNPNCVWHDMDIPEGDQVIDVNGSVYCCDFCHDEVTCGD